MRPLKTSCSLKPQAGPHQACAPILGSCFSVFISHFSPWHIPSPSSSSFPSSCYFSFYSLAFPSEVLGGCPFYLRSCNPCPHIAQFWCPPLSPGWGSLGHAGGCLVGERDNPWLCPYGRHMSLDRFLHLVSLPFTMRTKTFLLTSCHLCALPNNLPPSSRHLHRIDRVEYAFERGWDGQVTAAGQGSL